MAARNRDQLQGLLMMDARLRDPSTALWKARSTYSQAGPRPGRCVPARDTEALLVASGAQADGTVLDLLAVEGGPVGRDPRAAGLAWKNSSDGPNGYRGREIPATLSAWEVLSWRSTTGHSNPHSVTLEQEGYRDRVVVVAEDITVDGTDIVSWYRNTDGTLSSSVVVHDATFDGSGTHPCLVEAGDRLFCLHWSRGIGSASDSFFVRVQMSLDGGATWETVRRQASVLRTIKASVTHGSLANVYAAGRLRAAYLEGQVVVFGHLQHQLDTASTDAADIHIQWASSNLATKLERIEITSPAPKADGISGGPMDVVTAAGAFVVTWVQPDGALYSARLGSAYQPLSAVGGDSTAVLSGLASIATSPDRIVDYDLATVVDDLGLLWTYGRYCLTGSADTGLLQVVYSDSDGTRWETVGSSDDTPGSGTSAVWCSGRTGGGNHHTDHYLQGFAVCWQRARAVMVTGWYAATGVNDRSLSLAYLGGYHDLTIAPIGDGVDFVDRHPWQRTRLPIERAQDTAGWNVSSTGSNANALQSNGSELLSSGDGTLLGSLAVDQLEGTTGDTLLVATFAAKGSNSGANATTDRAAFTFRVDDGVRAVELGIYLEPSAFGVYDRVSLAQLALVSGLPNEVREWRVSVYRSENGSVTGTRVFYRSWENPGASTEDRQWVFAGAFSLAVTTSGLVGSNRVAYGCFTTTVAQADLEVYHGPHYTVGDRSSSTCLSGCAYTWADWVVAVDNPTHLSLTPMSSLPVYQSGGVSVSGVDGPAMASDSWQLAPVYEYPIERIHPAHSRTPRTRWRSVNDTASVTIALALDPTLLATQDSHAGAPLYGVWLGGVNFRTAEIHKVVGGTSVKVADIDMAAAFGSVGYSRQGATLIPGNDLNHQIAGQELVGWDFRTVGASPNVVRRCLGNRGGRWHTGTSAGPRVRVHLDKIDGTEPNSGNGFFCARSGVAVFEVPQADTTAGWELVIPAQDTVEGFFEIGALVLGPVWVAGQAPDWGRRLEQVLGTAYVRQRNGDVHATNQAPPGLGVEVSFAGGVDSSQFHAGGEPTHVETTDTVGVEGAATVTATLYDLMNELAANGKLPLVYLPKIPRSDGSADVRMLTRWFEYLYAHAPKGLRITAPLGDEGLDENLTAGALQLEPEL